MYNIFINGLDNCLYNHASIVLFVIILLLVLYLLFAHKNLNVSAALLRYLRMAVNPKLVGT
jgi:hypothetical protein